MEKKLGFAIIIMKILFSISLMQLFAICVYLMPLGALEYDTYLLSLYPYIPEYIFNAAFTALIAPLSYYLTVKRIK